MRAIHTPAIKAVGLRKSYRGGKDVLRGVSFAVEPGAIFAYLGRNGAGKSTTVRILATLTLPTGGCARVQGLDVRTDAARGFMTDPFDWGALMIGIAYPLAIAAATLALAARPWSAMNRAT